MRLGIFGNGRLGTAILEAARQAPDMEVVWQTGLEGAPALPVDVAIDATVAEAVPSRVAWALAQGTPLVIGTTGWSMPDLATRVTGHIGVLVSPNFSLTVALMARLSTVLGRYCQPNPERDPFVMESHHARKADAPSGTAIRLAEALRQGCPRKTHWALGPVPADGLSVGVVRAGRIFGQHTVGFDSPQESFELTHIAHSRAVFGAGALEAARFIEHRTGLFTMDDLAANLLDPLFTQVMP